MSKGDLLIERGARGLQELSRKAAAKGGIAAKMADELAEDAEFLRKLKPSLIKARAKGELPTNEKPGTARRAPGRPQLGARPKRRNNGGGPNPWLVIGVAVVAGVLLAKTIDWRGHAHPSD
jgi:hypothetical protein